MSAAKGKSKGQRTYDAYSTASVGLEMGAAVFLGWGLGYWLDREFDTKPYLMLLFLLCGVA
ncbi:MAG: AtpZ/AtpI family protein, partial [Myxococcota bacterium]